MNTLNFKIFSITIFMLCNIIDVSAQIYVDQYGMPEPSRRIFSSITTNTDSINLKQIPDNNHFYYLKRNPCYRYIFRPNKIIEYESHCPICYTLNGVIGNYNYLDNNIIEIESHSISMQSQFVDRIELKSLNDDKLSFEILTDDLDRVGKILTVYYTKRPTIFHKTNSISLQHDDLNDLIDQKIIIEEICLEVYVNNERKLFYIPLKWKTKLKSKTYSIVLRKNGYQIKKKKNKYFIYNWEHQSQKFKKNR